MNLLCKVGLHKWGEHELYGMWQYLHWERKCERCGKVQKSQSMKDKWDEKND